MKISEIVKREKDNKDIVLHKEGLFWRAYEYSAYCFVTNIKSYNVLHKFYKNIGQDIVYIGFPGSYLEKVIEICRQKKISFTKTDETIVEIKGFLQSADFDSWKNKIIKHKASELEENDILKQISGFPLASKTPIEAQQFLNNIQKQINGDL
jgi:hydroxymethylpyrimidine pyrophosphatase-like HAD family hydrolase